MTEQYLPSTDLTGATVEDDAETTVSSKESLDEQPIRTNVDENGYESECSSSTRSEEDVARSALEVEADAFTRFIERQRVEVMFELRNIRLGERPVTGQPNRERIESFLNHIQENQQETRAPSARPAAPSAHIADIDALTDRRCVSRALSSAAFRQDLENAIRHTIGTRPIQPVPQAPPAPAVPIQPPPQQRAAQTTPVVHPIPVQAPPMNIERQENELQAWQAITEIQRERIVVEISDLVHRQLVSTALESDFRRHLERNVLNRLARGAPIQQDPPAVVVRPTPAQPQRPTTDAPATNMTDLTTRLDSMQQMLQLMFTMQMDMQRSLRQEVASALAQNATTTTTAHNHTPQPMQAGHCTVCLTAVADTVLYRCGHLCVCYICGLQLQQSTSVYGVKCPICRAPVEDILRVYRSSRDGE